MERSIHIENLHPDVDAANLCSKFKKFGKILLASIEFDEHFTSKCKGHVLFANPISVKEVLADMDGVKIMEKPMVIRKAHSESKFGCGDKKQNKIFIKNFDPEWDECDLMKLFERFGEIEDVQIPKANGKSNGYGSITFKERSSAKQAIEEMNDEFMGDKTLKVELYLPKSLREDLQANSLNYAKDLLDKTTQRNNLHVKNLPKNIDDVHFQKLFEKFGPVTSVKVARDEAGVSKGFGFVAFKSEKNAEIALFRMNGYTWNSHVLEVNFNQSKKQRQHFLSLLNSEDNCSKEVTKKYPNRLKSPTTPHRPKSTALKPKIPKPIFTFRSKP